MKHPSYIELMEQHGLLFSTPVTQGTYLWRERGIEIVNRAYKILQKSISETFPNREIRNITGNHPMLLKKDKYDSFFKEINPYGNNFQVNLNEAEFLVRPDITYLNGRYLARQKDIDNIMLGGVIDIYRQVKAKALMIDQQIWPLIFFAFADSSGEIDTNTDGMIKALGEFYDAILLPHIWTIHDGYEKYADKLVMPLMAEDSRNLTVMSTLFALSNTFSTQLRIKAKLFELGVTEKTFAMLYIYQMGNEFVFLPSSINPTAVILDETIENGSLIGYLHKQGIGTKRISIKGPVIKRESSKGNSLILVQGDNRKIKMINLITQEEMVLDDVHGIQDGLRQGDKKIYESNSEVMTSAMNNNIFQVTCVDCIGSSCTNNNWGFNGDFYPETTGECTVCGIRKGKKRMFLSSLANSRAKEKSK